MTDQRTAIPDFNLFNPFYAGATLTVETIDVDGNPTGILATLYEDLTSTTTLKNPQKLNSEGRPVTPVYVDEPVIAIMSGMLNAPDHQTGVIAANLVGGAVEDAQAAAIDALIFAGQAQDALNEALKKIGLTLPDPGASQDYIRANGAGVYIRRDFAGVRADIQAIGGLGAGPDNAIIKTLGTTGGDAERTGILVDDSNRANGWGVKPGAGVTAASYTVSAGDAGEIQTVDFAGAVTITLPQVSTEDLIDGFVVSFYHKQATSITFVTQGADVLQHPFGATQSAGVGSIITCLKVEDGTWKLAGEVV